MMYGMIPSSYLIPCYLGYLIDNSAMKLLADCKFLMGMMSFLFTL